MAPSIFLWRTEKLDLPVSVTQIMIPVLMVSDHHSPQMNNIDNITHTNSFNLKAFLYQYLYVAFGVFSLALNK